jgi:hypothetical protein
LRAGVGGSYLEILLYEGGCCGGGRRLRVCDEAKPDDVDNDDDDPGGGEQRSGVAALAEADAKEPESVYRRDDEGEAVGSCDGRQVDQHWVVNLSDAENIPRKTGDAGSGEFYGHPREGYDYQGGLTAEVHSEGGDQGAEESVIEAKVQAKEDENAGGNRLGKATVEIHGLVDPVAVAHVPDEAAEIAEGGCLAEGKWVVVLVVSENGPDQGKECDPTKSGSPDRHGPCDGKW